MPKTTKHSAWSVLPSVGETTTTDALSRAATAIARIHTAKSLIRVHKAAKFANTVRVVRKLRSEK